MDENHDLNHKSLMVCFSKSRFEATSRQAHAITSRHVRYFTNGNGGCAGNGSMEPHGHFFTRRSP